MKRRQFLRTSSLRLYGRALRTSEAVGNSTQGQSIELPVALSGLRRAVEAGIMPAP